MPQYHRNPLTGRRKLIETPGERLRRNRDSRLPESAIEWVVLIVALIAFAAFAGFVIHSMVVAGHTSH